LLHLVGYLYNWQMGFNSVFKGLRPLRFKQINIIGNHTLDPEILHRHFTT